MSLGRRDFIKTAAAFGAAGPALAQGACAPNLRVGILSDIHVTALSNADWFEKALRYFDGRKVDAVLITGDLTTWNKLSEFEAVATTWFKVFPGDRRSDGGTVTRLFLTGNHDVDGFSYAGAKFKTREEAEPESFFFHRDEFWRRLFHEGYEPIRARTVKGYTFILRNWHSQVGHPSLKAGDKFPLAVGMSVEVNPAPDFVAKVAPTLPGDRPFFYAQHDRSSARHGEPVVRPSVRRDGEGPCRVSERPCALGPQPLFADGRALDLAGGVHGGQLLLRARLRLHAARPRERALHGRRQPRSAVRDGHDRHQAREAGDGDGGVRRPHHVPSARVRLRPAARPRLDGAALRRAHGAAERTPAFPADAEVVVAEIDDGHRRDKSGRKLDPKPRKQVIVSFPPIVTGAASPSRGFDFSVTAEMRVADMTQVIQEKRVFSPNVYMAEEEDVEPVTCAFARADIPKRRDVRFVVCPIDCWGKKGSPIASPWRRFAT